MTSFDPEAKWRLIEADLRAQIAQGKLRPGDRIPSEQVLAEEHGVVRMTARNAVLELIRAGLVTRGRIRTVARHEPLTVHVTRVADHTWEGEIPSLGADAWVGDMHRAGRNPVQLIDVLTTTAGPDIAQLLGIGDLSIVIVRKLLRLAGEQPHNLITFWFPLSVAGTGTPLAGPESIKEGSLGWLETHHGPLSHQVRVSSRMPTAAEVSQLEINSGSPVMVVQRTSRNTERPVVCSMAVYPADRAQLQLDL